MTRKAWCIKWLVCVPLWILTAPIVAIAVVGGYVDAACTLLAELVRRPAWAWWLRALRDGSDAAKEPR